MSGAGLRGVSAEQDARFLNKEKKLLKSMKFPAEFSTKVDLRKVNWEVMKPWIARRVTEMLGGLEDEVLIAYIYEQLEGKREVDPRLLQINLTGFLEKNTSLFCKELWALLASAASNPSGIPQQFLDEKLEEARRRKAEEERIQARLREEAARREAERREAAEQRAGERRRSRSRSRERDRKRHSRWDADRVERRRSRSRSRERRRDKGREERRRSRSRSHAREAEGTEAKPRQEKSREVGNK